MASKRRKPSPAARAGADTRRRKRAPLYGAWNASYAETVAARTGRLPTAAEVDKDPTFRAAVDKLISHGARTSKAPTGRLAKALETIGLRSPDWDRKQGGDVGNTPTARANKWARERSKKARAALKRGERRQDRQIREEFERAMLTPPRRKRKPAKRATVAKRKTSRKKQRSGRKRGRRRK